jgi:hypothetical protein
VRQDIEELKRYISWDKTLEKFGEPKNNKSQVVSVCFICAIEIEIKILSLKNRLRNKNKILCNKCAAKESWTDQKREKIQEKWKDPKFRASQSEIRKKAWKDPKFIPSVMTKYPEENLSYGDHDIRFVSHDDIMTLTIMVGMKCRKCGSGVRSYLDHLVIDKCDMDIQLAEIKIRVIESFIENVPESCEEARKLNQVDVILNS